jgi:hypothetical protein
MRCTVFIYKNNGTQNKSFTSLLYKRKKSQKKRSADSNNRARNISRPINARENQLLTNHNKDI